MEVVLHRPTGHDPQEGHATSTGPLVCLEALPKNVSQEDWTKALIRWLRTFWRLVNRDTISFRMCGGRYRSYLVVWL